MYSNISIKNFFANMCVDVFPLCFIFLFCVKQVILRSIFRSMQCVSDCANPWNGSMTGTAWLRSTHTMLQLLDLVCMVYHLRENDYRYRSEIKSKTIGLYQITDITDFL